MRKEYVTAGIVVVIIGLGVGLYGIYLVQGIESELLNMTISHNSSLTYQIGQIAEISGVLLFLIGVCLMIVWGIITDKKTIPKSSLISQSEGTNKSSIKSYDEALNILRTRLAKGRVTKEQFEQMKKDLEEKYL